MTAMWVKQSVYRFCRSSLAKEIKYCNSRLSPKKKGSVPGQRCSGRMTLKTNCKMLTTESKRVLQSISTLCYPEQREIVEKLRILAPFRIPILSKPLSVPLAHLKKKKIELMRSGCGNNKIQFPLGLEATYNLPKTKNGD